jgi:starch synthase
VRVLFAASEVAPLSKTGGLADVAHALPKALHRLGQDVRVVTPAYRGLLERLEGRGAIGRLELRGHAFTIWEGSAGRDAPRTWLVDCPALFAREGSLYTDATGREFADNALRFGLFGELVARLAVDATGVAWRPDVVHLNDWHTGLAAAWIVAAGPGPGVVFTIHNLAYQGNYPPEATASLGLPPDWMTPAGLEFHGLVSFMKAGLTFSHALTTVSPTYALEIQTPAYGEGMDGVLRGRARDLVGILNGIDEDAWDPQTDPHLRKRYGLADVAEGKRENRRALCERLGLAHDPSSLLAVYVGRLAWQKGVELFLDPAAAIDRPGLQVAILAAGDRALEQSFRDYAMRRAGRVAVAIGYDEPLAHLMEAGADTLLMPSRYEPCGLNQMYSQHYGTIPVVRRTGGLADTVVDATAETLANGSATGVCFEHADATALGWGIGKAIELRREPGTWRALQQAGMQRDFGWSAAAAKFIELYRSLGARLRAVAQRSPIGPAGE